MDDLITLDELAALVRRDRKTIINWRAQRKPGMPVGIRPGGGRAVLFRRKDVEAWIERLFAEAEAQRR